MVKERKTDIFGKKLPTGVEIREMLRYPDKTDLKLQRKLDEEIQKDKNKGEYFSF